MKINKIAVAGTGYVGLSLATLLAQNNSVVAVDVVKEKVDLINNRKSPIQDKEIEEYLAHKSRLPEPGNHTFPDTDPTFCPLDRSGSEYQRYL